LALPQAPSAPKGTCRWCGEKLKGKRAKIRRYCYKDREGRDCVKAYRDSMTWNPRTALRILARRAGKTELRCVDCGFVVELLHRGRIARVIVVPWEADHEIPLWEGGEHNVANLRVRCVPDHRAKTARESARRAKRRS
jgi:5-methylcytosine-specific restriction endonuclease McrA